MTAHNLTRQNSSVGRFGVCSCAWRTPGFGDAAYVADEFARHLRTVGEAAK